MQTIHLTPKVLDWLSLATVCDWPPHPAQGAPALCVDCDTASDNDLYEHSAE